MIRIRIRKANMIKGAFVVVLDEENRALMLLRPPWISWGASQWAYPGGKIEKGETPEEAAIRETKEETSLDVFNMREVDAYGQPVKAYYTKDYVGDVKIDFEHDDWKWMSHDEMQSHPLAPGVLDIYNGILNNERS